MKKVLSSILALSLLVAMAAMFIHFPVFANAKITNKITQYTVVNSDNQITVIYDKESKRLIVGIFKNDNGAGYVADNVENPIGVQTLELKREHIKAGAAKTITIKITEFNDTSTSFSINDHISKIEGSYVTSYSRPGLCSNPSGTGVCDNIQNNLQWTNCFLCCLLPLSGCEG